MTRPALCRLARFVVDDPLMPDPDTLDVLRDGVIDTLGCILAGVRTEVAFKTRAAVQAMSVEGGAEVLGVKMTTSRPHAAFLNAVAGHALDFDDWELPGNTHPTVVLLPAMLAVMGSKATGRDLAQAYLAGFEVIARLGEALNFEHYDAGWHSTATFGAPAAAAACARLMGLDASETTHAMSLSISAIGGYTCQFGSNAKPVQAGFAARAGVEAACLARAGVTGQAHVLDHERGQAVLMGGLVPDRLEAALGKLGTGYALAEYGLVLKPWPSCGYTHRIMTCARRLYGRIDPTKITAIDLYVPDFHAAVLPFVQPRSIPEALFSLPFVAAMGLVNGNLTLADLTRQAWKKPMVERLIGKSRVHAFAPNQSGQNYSAKDPDRLVVTFQDGQIIEESCSFPTGAPQSPMSQSQLWEKFAANTGPVPDSWVEKLRIWPELPAVSSLFCRQGEYA
ncbi:MmgE/PrpD family protein [Ruegeria arenilitoris]|uniref:MmgE/PrpD family protein n=1 Tax=Ruegeria arenilitoris TaxID=1173585 RepID=UPI00147DB8E6|nr:MmgE/PrpD family protein [Ruegeria arenilitoris]